MNANLAGAIGALRNGQQQLDAEGTIVGVSRQALEEVLAAVDTQSERAEAYYRNLVSMLFSARVELESYVAKNGSEGMEVYLRRDRLRGLLAVLEEVERGDYHLNCEACGKPLLNGQKVIHYDDAGDIHLDCDNPDNPQAGHKHAHAYDDGFQCEWAEKQIEAAKAALVDPEDEAGN